MHLAFRDPVHPDYVCLHQKSLYVLNQAPWAWFHRFVDFVTSINFCSSISDNSLFVYCHGSDIAYLLLYVDDIVLTASFNSLRYSFMYKLSSEFAMKDLGPLSYFMGIAVSLTYAGLFVSQQKYVAEILDKARMSQCKPTPTPVTMSSKLCANASSPYSDPTLYRCLPRALENLTFTPLDISYAVQQVCLFMDDPQVAHMAILHRILQYIQGTQLYKSPISSLLSYTDAN